jgi:predicted aminopeptidase
VLLLATRERLKALYAEPIAADVMRERKQQEFGRLKYEYAQMKAQRWNGYAGYDHWFDRALNNADLVPIATYYACVPGFRRLLEAQHGDFKNFYVAVERIAKLPKRERDAQLCSAAAS